MNSPSSFGILQAAHFTKKILCIFMVHIRARYVRVLKSVFNGEEEFRWVFGIFPLLNRVV